MRRIGDWIFVTVGIWIGSDLAMVLITFVTASEYDIVEKKVEISERVENLKKSQLRRRPVRFGKSVPLALKMTYMANQRAANRMVVVRASNSEFYKMQTKNSNGFDVNTIWIENTVFISAKVNWE